MKDDHLISPSMPRAGHARPLQSELPRPIRTDRDLERAIARLEELDERDESLTPEERELAELYASLIEAYEDQRYPIPRAAPHEFLRALLEDRGLSQADIAPLLGGRGHASEILSGKRSVSKAQAKSLAAHFGLSVEVFI
jgi:HTH-type transcriptional regulator/antitoxin HigA